MRIAIVHENWGAGAARCARDLETGLGRNHDVIYFPRTEKENLQSVLQGLNDFRPDVVSCHSFYADMPYTALITISKRYPTCFTVHDPRPIGMIDVECWTCDHNGWCLRCPLNEGKIHRTINNRYFRSRLKKKLTHRLCAPDMVLAPPSQWMAKRLGAQELSRFKITHIPLGLDLERFKPRAPERAKFGLPEKGIVLLHLAWHAGKWSINERKGLRFLSEAFVNHIVPKFPDTYLAVAGESFAPNHPNVRTLGMVDQKDLPALLGSVDVFVTPTLADNFPYTVIEAMACGKAVVASRVGGIPEQVDEGKTGFMVPAGDPEALAHALSRLLQDPALIGKFGEAARLKAEREYGMQKFIGAYESLFQELAQGRA